MNEPTTLTGKTFDEVVEAMKDRLPADAYSEIESAKYLTQIDPSYLREKLTECFGLAGYGWWYDFTDDAFHVIEGTYSSGKKNFTVSIKRLELRYMYRLGDEILRSEAILASGGSTNSELGDAIKGATTSALSKAGAMLLFQLDVYKGILTHKNVRKLEDVTRSSPPEGNGSKKREKREETLKELRERAVMVPEEFGPTEYWSTRRVLDVDQDTAFAIVDETDGWAEALIALLDQFGGPEVAG